jgi:NAD(P)-dependent dehydrogenase (short-subunit alcohol dehydrogenase family)
VSLETARQLLDLGCKMMLAVHSTKKGEAAQQDLSKGRTLAKGMIEVWELDLSSYDSITSFAERTKTLEYLDIAVLCTGVYNVVEAFGSAGYEESYR